MSDNNHRKAQNYCHNYNYNNGKYGSNSKWNSKNNEGISNENFAEENERLCWNKNKKIINNYGGGDTQCFGNHTKDDFSIKSKNSSFGCDYNNEWYDKCLNNNKNKVKYMNSNISLYNTSEQTKQNFHVENGMSKNISKSFSCNENYYGKMENSSYNNQTNMSHLEYNNSSNSIKENLEANKKLLTNNEQNHGNYSKMRNNFVMKNKVYQNRIDKSNNPQNFKNNYFVKKNFSHYLRNDFANNHENSNKYKLFNNSINANNNVKGENRAELQDFYTDKNYKCNSYHEFSSNQKNTHYQMPSLFDTNYKQNEKTCDITNYNDLNVENKPYLVPKHSKIYREHNVKHTNNSFFADKYNGKNNKTEYSDSIIDLNQHIPEYNNQNVKYTTYNNHINYQAESQFKNKNNLLSSTNHNANDIYNHLNKVNNANFMSKKLFYTNKKRNLRLNHTSHNEYDCDDINDIDKNWNYFNRANNKNRLFKTRNTVNQNYDKNVTEVVDQYDFELNNYNTHKEYNLLYHDEFKRNLNNSPNHIIDCSISLNTKDCELMDLLRVDNNQKSNFTINENTKAAKITENEHFDTCELNDYFFKYDFNAQNKKESNLKMQDDKKATSKNQEIENGCQKKQTTNIWKTYEISKNNIRNDLEDYRTMPSDVNECNDQLENDIRNTNLNNLLSNSTDQTNITKKEDDVYKQTVEFVAECHKSVKKDQTNILVNGFENLVKKKESNFQCVEKNVIEFNNNNINIHNLSESQNDNFYKNFITSNNQINVNNINDSQNVYHKSDLMIIKNSQTKSHILNGDQNDKSTKNDSQIEVFKNKAADIINQENFEMHSQNNDYEYKNKEIKCLCLQIHKTESKINKAEKSLEQNSIKYETFHIENKKLLALKDNKNYNDDNQNTEECKAVDINYRKTYNYNEGKLFFRNKLSTEKVRCSFIEGFLPKECENHKSKNGPIYNTSNFNVNNNTNIQDFKHGGLKTCIKDSFELKVDKNDIQNNPYKNKLEKDRNEIGNDIGLLLKFTNNNNLLSTNKYFKYKLNKYLHNGKSISMHKENNKKIETLCKFINKKKYRTAMTKIQKRKISRFIKKGAESNIKIETNTNHVLIDNVVKKPKFNDIIGTDCLYENNKDSNLPADNSHINSQQKTSKNNKHILESRKSSIESPANEAHEEFGNLKKYIMQDDEKKIVKTEINDEILSVKHDNKNMFDDTNIENAEKSIEKVFIMQQENKQTSINKTEKIKNNKRSSKIDKIVKKIKTNTTNNKNCSANVNHDVAEDFLDSKMNNKNPVIERSLKNNKTIQNITIKNNNKKIIEKKIVAKKIKIEELQNNSNNSNNDITYKKDINTKIINKLNFNNNGTKLEAKEIIDKTEFEKTNSKDCDVNNNNDLYVLSTQKNNKIEYITDMNKTINNTVLCHEIDDVCKETSCSNACNLNESFLNSDLIFLTKKHKFNKSINKKNERKNKNKKLSSIKKIEVMVDNIEETLSDIDVNDLEKYEEVINNKIEILENNFALIPILLDHMLKKEKEKNRYYKNNKKLESEESGLVLSNVNIENSYIKDDIYNNAVFDDLSGNYNNQRSDTNNKINDTKNKLINFTQKKIDLLNRFKNGLISKEHKNNFTFEDKINIEIKTLIENRSFNIDNLESVFIDNTNKNESLKRKGAQIRNKKRAVNNKNTKNGEAKRLKKVKLNEEELVFTKKSNIEGSYKTDYNLNADSSFKDNIFDNFNHTNIDDMHDGNIDKLNDKHIHCKNNLINFTFDNSNKKGFIIDDIISCKKESTNDDLTYLIKDEINDDKHSCKEDNTNSDLENFKKNQSIDKLDANDKTNTDQDLKCIENHIISECFLNKDEDINCNEKYSKENIISECGNNKNLSNALIKNPDFFKNEPMNGNIAMKVVDAVDYNETEHKFYKSKTNLERLTNTLNENVRIEEVNDLKRKNDLIYENIMFDDFNVSNNNDFVKDETNKMNENNFKIFDPRENTFFNAFVNEMYPTQIAEDKLDDYISQQLSNAQKNVMVNEAILDMVDTKDQIEFEILDRITINEEVEWNEDEINIFEHELKTTGKNFFNLQNKLGNKTIKDIVLHYYRRKLKLPVKRKAGRMSDEEMKRTIEKEWEEDEICLFITFMHKHGKEWNLYKENLPERTERELKLIYRYVNKYRLEDKIIVKVNKGRGRKKGCKINKTKEITQNKKNIKENEVKQKLEIVKPKPKVNLSKDEIYKRKILSEFSVSNRQLFAIYFPFIGRNWSELSQFVNKNVNDLRMYFKYHFKDLSPNEKKFETNLREIEKNTFSIPNTPKNTIDDEYRPHC
ncbi:hypothetical protein COBT_001129, partial [Conglomerata obtusa]